MKLPHYMVTRPFGACAAVVLLAAPMANAATIYWDGTDTTGNADGGNGTWDTTLTNWDTLVLGGSNTTWNNATPDLAVFGGLPGNVALGSGITVGGLQFNTTGYLITTGANTLTLSGTTNLTLNNVALATINGTLGGSGALNFTSTNPGGQAGTLAFTGATTGGWSGSTTIGPNLTVTLDAAASFNRNLLNTSAIILNGGGISSGVIANDANAGADRINDSANWTVNSGSFTWGSSNAGGTYAETIGTVTLNRGQMNFTLNGNLSSGSQTLTLTGLTQTGTSAVTFSNNATALDSSVGAGTDVIRVNGITTSTSAGQIIGPWATVGASAASQTDYARYISDGTYGYVVAAGASLTSTGETSWSASTDAYQFGAATTLTATRTAGAIRYTGAAAALGLGASNFNLQTYGVLNGGSGVLTISTTGTGGLTAPSGGGNLYLTSGSNGITVSAPINDNGGAVTVVVGGTGGSLTLSSTTSNYSGGTVLNSGTLIFTADSNLGSGGGITVNGAATINGGDQYNLVRTLTLNDGANLTLNNGFGVTGVFSGNGALNVTSADDFNFTNAANTFTGAITSATSANTGYGLKFNSIGDTAGAGLITLVGGSGTFHWMSASGTTTTLVNRQFAISGTGSGMILARGTTAASNLVINKDLLITGAAGARTLTLEGTNLGNNTFAGRITDGIDGGASVVSLSKAGASLWIISNTGNSYTGGTTVSAGTLQLGASDVLSSGNVTVSGGTLQLGTFSDTVGTVNISGGTIDGTTGVLSGSSVNASGTSTISVILGGSGSLNRGIAGSTTTLSKANTYSGGTNVVGGTLAVTSSGVLGQNVVGNGIAVREAGILTLAASGNSGSNQTITLSSSATSDGRFGNLAVLGLGYNGLPAGAIAQANTTGGIIAINGITGYNTDLSSTLTGKNLFLGAIGTSTFTGAAGTVAAGNGSLYRLGGGGGQITFNTTNLFTGANGVQSGSFLTNGGGTVVISAAQDYSGTTTVSAGTLTLSGASGSAISSSSFTLNGGKLFLDSSGTNNTNRIGTVAVSLSTGGELSFSGNASGTTETIGDLSIGAGISTVTVKATTASSVLGAGAFSRTNNGTALFRGTSLGQNVTPMGRVTLTDTSGLTFVGASTLNNAANGDTTKDVRIIPYLVGGTTDVDTGSTFVTYDTTLGFRALSTANQFNTTVTAGTNVRLAAAQTGITTASINSLIIANTGSSTIADGNTLTITSGALLFSAAGTIAPATSTGILDFGAAQAIITTPANGVISTQITGSGGLLKAGTGTLTLSNANNNYSGGTIINAGTIIATSATALGGSGANLTFSGTGTLNYNPNPAAAISLGTLTVNAGVTGTILSGGASNSAQTYNITTLAGSGTLASNSDWPDTLNLGNASSFTGNIYIQSTSGSAGQTLTFNSLADTSGSYVRFGGTAKSNGATTQIFTLTGDSGSLTFDNRQIQISSSGVNGQAYTTTLTNNNTTAANKWVINTNLFYAGGVNTAAVNLGLAGSNSGDNQFAGVISDGPAGGALGVTKSGNGKWILSGTNTYTGTTSVSAGTLLISGSISTGATSATGGTLALSNGNALQYSALTLSGGTLSLLHNTNSTTFATAGMTITGTSTINVDNNGSGVGNTLNLGGAINATNAGAMTLNVTGGNSYGLSVGAITQSSTTGGAFTISNTAPLTIASYTTYSTSSPGLQFIGSGNTSVTGLITQNASGALALTQNGSGTTTLLGSNTYRGATTLTTGRVQVGVNSVGSVGAVTSSAIGTGTLTFNGGGISSDGATARTIFNALSFTGNATLGDETNSGKLTFAANASLGATRTLTVNSTAEFSGVISGATFGITKAGFGELILSGANSYTGVTTAQSGTFTLDMASGGSLNSASALTLASNTNVLGTFQVKGASSGTSAQTMGALSLGNNANGRIVIDPNGGTSTTLTLGDAWSFGSGTSLLIDYSSSNSGTRRVITANATTTTTLSNGIYGRVLVKDSSGIVGFGTRAAGSNQTITRFDDTTGTTLAVASNTAATNFTTLNSVYVGGNGGTLTWTNAGALTARSVNSLTIDTTTNYGTIDMGVSTNVLTLTSLGLLFKGGNNATMTGGQVGVSGSEAIIHQTGSGTLTINSLLGGGASVVTKDGTGILVLGGNNTFTGSFSINEGTVRLGSAGSGANTPLGTTGQTTRVSNGAALDLGGFTLATQEGLVLLGTGISGGGALMNSGGDANWSGAITLNSAASIVSTGNISLLSTATVTNGGNALTLGGTGTNSSAAGVISGAGGLTKEGAGKWTLSAANNYTGATTVSNGTLVVSSTGTINTTSVITVAAGGALRYNSSTALTKAPTLAGNGTSNRAVLGGTGTINAAVTLDNLGDVLSPGNSPGVQNYAVGQTWSSFSYDWELNDWTAAVAGTNIDQITITGTLDLSAVTANQYILNVLSLMNDNSSGLVGSGGGNLFSEINNSWTILTATTITGFNASEWSINAAGFTDNETGTWSISQSGNSLLLNYAAVPEPSVALLGGLSLLGLVLRRRRR